MTTHLQYHIKDTIESITDTRDIVKETNLNNGRDRYSIYNTITPMKFSNELNPDSDYIINEEYVKIYKNYRDNLRVIREDTDKAIKDFISSGGRIKDLLYRMNTLDPIDREYNNRAFKLNTLNDNFNNFITNYKSSGKDDMVTIGLMNHEVNSILLYLLIGSGIYINIDYKVNKIMNFIYRTSNLKEIIEVNDSLSLNPSPSYKWFLLQSLYDSSFVNKIPFICNLSKSNQTKYEVNKDDDTLGRIYFMNKDISCSLAMLILRLYKHNKLFENESIHNMCRIPVYISTDLLNHEYECNYFLQPFFKFFITEEFRNILHTMTIILHQLLVFSFMEYCNIPKDTEIKNVVDRHLYKDREFQKLWIIIEEKYNQEELFKLFKDFMTYILVDMK